MSDDVARPWQNAASFFFGNIFYAQGTEICFRHECCARGKTSQYDHIGNVTATVAPFSRGVSVQITLAKMSRSKCQAVACVCILDTAISLLSVKNAKNLCRV